MLIALQTNETLRETYIVLLSSYLPIPPFRIS